MILGILKKALLKREAGNSRRVTGRDDMNAVAMLRGAEPRQILELAIEKEVPAIMSYLSRGKWHMGKVLLTDMGANMLKMRLSPRKKPHPINIQVDQPVGISFKYRYGKFVFETKVIRLEPSADQTSGGTIVVAVPDRIEIVQRRSYFRVKVPESLKVNVLLWHRCHIAEDSRVPPSHYCQGKLIDISAGGAQIAIDATQSQDFKDGQFIGVRFTPMPYETPLIVNAQVRNVLPTVDDKSVCLGLQIVGLEASSEGREVLQRLCSVVERYYQLDQSSARQQDFQGTPNPV